MHPAAKAQVDACLASYRAETSDLERPRSARRELSPRVRIQSTERGEFFELESINENRTEPLARKGLPEISTVS